MRDDHGHEFQRWGVCRRCGCDHGDLKATEPCPGELPDLQTQPMPVVRPPVLPNGPSRRRRRIEDVALIDFTLRATLEMDARGLEVEDMAIVILAAFTAGLDPHDIVWASRDYVHNPNCGGTCGDRCNG